MKLASIGPRYEVGCMICFHIRLTCKSAKVQKSKRPIGLSLTGLVWVQCRKTLQRFVEMVAISSFTNKKAYTSFATGTPEVLLNVT